MVRKQGNILVTILIVPLLIATSVAGYFFWQNQKNSKIETSKRVEPSPMKNTLTQPESAWKTIKNQTLGFQFEVPNEWVEDPVSNSSERNISVASCQINACDRISIDIQVSPRSLNTEGVCHLLI